MIVIKKGKFFPDDNSMKLNKKIDAQPLEVSFLIENIHEHRCGCWDGGFIRSLTPGETNPN